MCCRSTTHDFLIGKYCLTGLLVWRGGGVSTSPCPPLNSCPWNVSLDSNSKGATATHPKKRVYLLQNVNPHQEWKKINWQAVFTNALKSNWQRVLLWMLETCSTVNIGNMFYCEYWEHILLWISGTCSTVNIGIIFSCKYWEYVLPWLSGTCPKLWI